MRAQVFWTDRGSGSVPIRGGSEWSSRQFNVKQEAAPCTSCCFPHRYSPFPRAVRWSPSRCRTASWRRYGPAAPSQRSSITPSSAPLREKGQLTAYTTSRRVGGACVTSPLSLPLSALQRCGPAGGGAPEGDGRSAGRVPGTRQEQPDPPLCLAPPSAPCGDITSCQSC